MEGPEYQKCPDCGDSFPTGFDCTRCTVDGPPPKPVMPTHRSVPRNLCVCCGKEPDGACLGKKRRKLARLVEAIEREEKRRAKGHSNAGLLAAMAADADILRREIARIVKMEAERDEAWIDS